MGDLVYQPHKDIPRFLELKNLRVHPDFRVRDFGRFMLRQVEVEYSGDALLCDVRASQFDIVRFLESCGYTSLAPCTLYDPNTPEIVMIKYLKKDKEQILIARAMDFIQRRML